MTLREIIDWLGDKYHITGTNNDKHPECAIDIAIAMSLNPDGDWLTMEHEYTGDIEAWLCGNPYHAIQFEMQA